MPKNEIDFLEESKLITDMAIDILSSETNEAILKPWQRLQSSAAKYMSIHQEMISSSDNIKAVNYHIRDLIESATKAGTFLSQVDAAKASTANSAEMKKVYKEAFEFEASLDEFLGNIPREMAVVTRNDKTGEIQTAVMPKDQIPELLGVENKILSYKNKVPDEKVGILEDELREKKPYLNEHIKQLQRAYQRIIDRSYWHYTSSSKKGAKKDGKYLDSIYVRLREHDTKEVARINNEGTLMEGYVNLLLQPRNSKLYKEFHSRKNSKNINNLINIFLEASAESVDSQVAILGEDVYIYNRHIGVKKGGSKMPGIAQYYNAALWIINQKRPFSKQRLAKQLIDANRESSKGQIQLLTNKELKKIVGKEYKTIMKELDKLDSKL